MNILYKTAKKLYLPLLASCMSLCGLQTAKAQPFYTLGVVTGPNNNGTAMPNPFPDSYDAARQQYLILASELTAPSVNMPPGKILTIQFYNQSGGSNIENYTVSMVNTAVTTLSNASWVPGTLPVYFNSSFSPASINWTGPTLTTPFAWDGVSNIVIEICHTQTVRGTSPLMTMMTTSFNSSHSSGQNGGSPSGCGSTSLPTLGTVTQRPILRFTLAPNCLPPTNLRTTNIKPYTADISWNASITPATSMNGYNYLVNQVRESPYPASTTTNTLAPTILTQTEIGLTPSTKYYIHLRSDCTAAGAGTDTSGWLLDSFTTLPDCIPPVPTIDQITFSTAVASWPPVPTAYDYEYAVALNNMPPSSGTKTQSTTVYLPGLAESKYYYFFVRARCSPTPLSLWNKVEFNTLKTTGFEDVNADGFAVISYPNPIKDVVTIEVKNASDNASVQVLDLTGKVVRTAKINGSSININMAGLTAGMYMVKYTDRLHSDMIKLIKE